MSDTQQKYHKLASALYLVTSFFADQEPLKWRLRSLAADLVSGKLAAAPEVPALLSLAQASGLLSLPNYEILRQQFSQEEVVLDFPREALPEPAHKAPIKDNLLLERPLEHKDDDRAVLKEFGAVSVKKNSRQSIIIGLLKRKKEVMIKDVSPLISGCSEKTIQRELSDMVLAGVLKRIGEKRWTRYTLA